MDLWSGFRIERVSRIALASIKMEIGSMLDSHTFKIHFSRRITQNHSLEGISRGIQIRGKIEILAGRENWKIFTANKCRRYM